MCLNPAFSTTENWCISAAIKTHIWQSLLVWHDLNYFQAVGSWVCTEHLFACPTNVSVIPNVLPATYLIAVAQCQLLYHPLEIQARVNVCAKREIIPSSTVKRSRRYCIHKVKKCSVRSPWPWPFIFDHQNQISLSLSPSEYLDQI